MPKKRQALVEFEDILGACNAVNYAADNQIYFAGHPAFVNYSTSQKISRPGDSDDARGVNNVLLFTILNPIYSITTVSRRGLRVYWGFMGFYWGLGGLTGVYLGLGSLTMCCSSLSSVPSTPSPQWMEVWGVLAWFWVPGLCFWGPRWVFGVPDGFWGSPDPPFPQDVLYTICNPCGPVQRIVIFRKNGVQAMVEYPGVHLGIQESQIPWLKGPQNPQPPLNSPWEL